MAPVSLHITITSLLTVLLFPPGIGNGTCPALSPFPEATQDAVNRPSQSAAHHDTINAAIASRNNKTLGALPLIGDYPAGHIFSKRQFGLGQAAVLAANTDTDVYTGLKVGQVRSFCSLNGCFAHRDLFSSV